MRDGSERAELLARLRSDIAACERPGCVPDRPAIPTGLPSLDRVLPLGGIRRGALVELLDARSGCGAETVAAVLTRAACRPGEAVVVVDPDRQFYPPALAAWGVPLGRLVVVHAADDADALWAADQALRCPAVGAVWLRRDRLAPHDARRLQLAAEDGGTLGVLFRPDRVRGRSTWADVQLAVGPRPAVRGRRLRVEVTRCRGGAAGAAVEVEFDDGSGGAREVVSRETPHVPAPAELAGPAVAG
jgi:protein ImuA